MSSLGGVDASFRGLGKVLERDEYRCGAHVSVEAVNEERRPQIAQQACVNPMDEWNDVYRIYGRCLELINSLTEGYSHLKVY